MHLATCSFDLIETETQQSFGRETDYVNLGYSVCGAPENHWCRFVDIVTCPRPTHQLMHSGLILTDDIRFLARDKLLQLKRYGYNGRQKEDDPPETSAAKMFCQDPAPFLPADEYLPDRMSTFGVGYPRLGPSDISRLVKGHVEEFFDAKKRRMRVSVTTQDEVVRMAASPAG